MDKISEFSNAEVFDFYKELPFNMYSSPKVAVNSIKKTNSILRYKVLEPYLKEGNLTIDIGCGAGWLVNSINHYYDTKAIGIDFNDVAVDNAKKVSDGLGCNSHFEQADLFNYFPEEKADLVTSIGVLHHTNDAIKGLRHICQNIVKPGGMIFIGLYHTYGRKPFYDYFESLKKQGYSDEELFGKYKQLHPAQTDETHLKSWFRDQVLHPHETHHDMKEILKVLEEENMVFEKTSINFFNGIADIDELYDIEKETYLFAKEKLERHKYYPGFFIFTAIKD